MKPVFRAARIVISLGARFWRVNHAACASIMQASCPALAFAETDGVCSEQLPGFSGYFAVTSNWGRTASIFEALFWDRINHRESNFVRRRCASQRTKHPLNKDEPQCEVRISFQDCNETLLVTPIGPNQYRMAGSAVLGDVFYLDAIETELQTDGIVRFLRVFTPSGLIKKCWVVSGAVRESPALSALLERAMAVGGNWERIFGSVLTLHLPPHERDTIMGAINDLFK